MTPRRGVRGQYRAPSGVALGRDVEKLSADEIATILAGHDVVAWSAGVGGGNPERTYALDRDAVISDVIAE